MRQVSDITGFIANPVKGVSSAFAILFAVSIVLHIWQSSRYRSWYCTWYLPCGCIIFAASFICREYTAFHPLNDSAATEGLFHSAVIIVTAPLYLFLHSLLATHVSVIPIRPTYISGPAILLTFVGISIISQGASSFFGPEANDGSVSSGLALLKSSLVIQLFLNVAFLIIIAIFYLRCSSKGIFLPNEGQRTKTVLITLCISMAWVLVRNLFSTVQIFLPADSPAWTVEAYFWVFDAAAMLAYTMTLHLMPPAMYLQKEGACYTTRNATERVDDVEV